MFEVFWNNLSTGQLADIWALAGDRSAVTTAVASIEGRLRIDPLDFGESREGPERVVFVPPLVVRFRVVEDDRQVIVLSIRHLRHRSP